MSDIQRWGGPYSNQPDESGALVTYADHVEALRQASIGPAPLSEMPEHLWRAAGYEQGQRDALAAGKRVLTDDWYAVLESEVVGPHETAIKGGSDE